MTWIVKRLLTKDINISVPNDILNYLPEDIVINPKNRIISTQNNSTKQI